MGKRNEFRGEGYFARKTQKNQKIEKNIIKSKKPNKNQKIKKPKKRLILKEIFSLIVGGRDFSSKRKKRLFVFVFF